MIVPETTQDAPCSTLCLTFPFGIGPFRVFFVTPEEKAVTGSLRGKPSSRLYISH